MPHGTTYFANNGPGVALASEIVDAVACAEKVRFVCSGTEADLYAMRLARAFRRRDKILKFEGGYHGMSDYALIRWRQEPGQLPARHARSAGMPKRGDEMLVAAYNDLETARA